jgi:hypothetical protein
VSRYMVCEVYCDQCSTVIDHIHSVKGVSVNKQLRRQGAIVSKHGDFHNKDCLKEFIKENGINEQRN